MKDFLKNNLISLLVCLAALSGFAAADTLTRPYSSVDYQGGAKAVGAYVNAEFQNIVTWLNTGNISSQNIAASGVYNVNRGPANFKITSGSSLYTNTGSLSSVTNLSTTITTFGRPVLVRLEPANTAFLISSASTTKGYVTSSDSSGAGSFFILNRDNSTLAQQPIPYAGASNERLSPCSNYSFLDTPTAGSYTYSAAVVSNPGVTATVAGCRLSITEF